MCGDCQYLPRSSIRPVVSVSDWFIKGILSSQQFHQYYQNLSSQIIEHIKQDICVKYTVSKECMSISVNHGLSCFWPFCFSWSQRLKFCYFLVFWLQATWWGLFQKPLECITLNIYMYTYIYHGICIYHFDSNLTQHFKLYIA